VQRHIFAFIFNVDQGGVALIERAAPRVLAAQAHGDAALDQAGEGQSFSHAVVDSTLARPHFRALLQKLLHLRMNVKVRRIRG
jgi:hypothetical protein